MTDATQRRMGGRPNVASDDTEQAFNWLQHLHREVVARKQHYGPYWWTVAPLEPGWNHARRFDASGSPLGGSPRPEGWGWPGPHLGLEVPSSGVIRKLVAMIQAHEGGYDAVNRNTDGAGVSVGIFQWPQRTGGLAVVLSGYYKANPALFVQIFGPAWRELLQKTAARSMEPVAGALLWAEPWVSRFQVAGRQPVFQVVQDRLAVEGPFFQAAFAAADLLGLNTERAVAVTLDAAVSQGPQFAKKAAARVRRLFEGKAVPMSEVLAAYLMATTAHFRSTTPPAGPPKAAHLSWRKVGNEWHIYAGQIDLYANVMNRRGKIIGDASLSDDPLSAREAVV